MNTANSLRNKPKDELKPFLLISRICDLSKTTNIETIFNGIFRFSTLLMLLICSCTNGESNQSTANNNAIKTQPLKGTIQDDVTYYEGESEETDFFVVICDTGTDYYLLRNQMLRMSQIIKSPIDSLDRYYDTDKKELILPEKYEDEMYAGQYYPRRFEGDFMSIEYLNQFNDKSNPKTLAIVAGIYANKSEADNRKMLLNQNGFIAHSSKCKLYTGCMH